MALISKIFIDTPRLFFHIATPIVLDFGIYKIASSRMYKQIGSTGAGLGAVFVLSRYSPNPRLIALFYLAYKALVVWSNLAGNNSKPSSSEWKWKIDDARLAALEHPLDTMLPLLQEKFIELRRHLKVDYPHPWTNWKDLSTFARDDATLQKVREGWTQHWIEAHKLVNEAAGKFEELRQEIWKKFDSAPTEEARHQQIAEFLQKDNSLEGRSLISYSGIHVRGFPKNLLEFYRFIRTWSYQVNYKNSESQLCSEIYTFPIDQPFAFYRDSEMNLIRNSYNRAIEKWLPMLEYLPIDSPYRLWIQKDEPNIHFNLNPPPLPRL
jgi:hypothetical protein